MTTVFFMQTLCIPGALALVSDFVLPGDSTVTVTVESTVTELTPGGEYLYSYQIRDIDSFISLLAIPFSTPLSNAAEIFEFACDGSAPFYWGIIENPAVAAHAFFGPSCLTGGSSPVLTFKSVYASGPVQGYVNDAQRGALYGTLLAPVPEPATFSLISIGMCMIFRRKKSKRLKTIKCADTILTEGGVR